MSAVTDDCIKINHFFRIRYDVLKFTVPEFIEMKSKACNYVYDAS